MDKAFSIVIKISQNLYIFRENNVVFNLFSRPIIEHAHLNLLEINLL